jgi:5-hydroxyisourate hydrolase
VKGKAAALCNRSGRVEPFGIGAPQPSVGYSHPTATPGRCRNAVQRHAAAALDRYRANPVSITIEIDRFLDRSISAMIQTRILARRIPTRPNGMDGMGRLTTHVLDTVTGLPAPGLVVELWTADTAPRLVRTVTTNADGRVDGPILEGDALVAGPYELRFHAGDYFRAAGVPLADPPFLDVIPIRFGIADTARHYHVPLLVSPYAYSTYRGS